MPSYSNFPLILFKKIFFRVKKWNTAVSQVTSKQHIKRVRIVRHTTVIEFSKCISKGKNNVPAIKIH